MSKPQIFCFDEEMIKTALEANGWSLGWNSDYWVHETQNADYEQSTVKEAFVQLLYKSNLISKDIERCWEND